MDAVGLGTTPRGPPATFIRVSGGNHADYQTRRPVPVITITTANACPAGTALPAGQAAR